MRKVYKICALLLVTTILVGSMVVPIANVTETSVSGSDLDDAKDKQKQIEQNKADKQKDIDNLKSQGEDLTAYIQELDNQIGSLQNDLYELREKIAAKEEEISDNEAALAQAEIDKDDQYDAMKLRIQFMYERNPQTYLSLLLNAENMGDMLNKAEYIAKISDYDREMLERLKETIDTIENTKAQLEIDYASLSEMEDNLEIQIAGLEVIEEEKNTQLANVQAAQSKAEAEMADLEADEEEGIALIAELEAAEKKRQEEEAAAAAAAAAAATNSGSTTTTSTSSVSYDGGMFQWPTVSTRITSNYGDSEDRSSGHQGIDIGAVNRGVAGDPVYAAYDGVVEAVSYSVTGGNYIIINHGNGLRTRYLHLSATGVTVGQTVSKGSLIGKMGTTGTASTGVHLHFDVWNGSKNVSPWNYLKAS